MLLSSALHVQLKLIVQQLLFTNVGKEGEQGRNQGLATVSGLQRGLMCQGKAVMLHSESQALFCCCKTSP